MTLDAEWVKAHIFEASPIFCMEYTKFRCEVDCIIKTWRNFTNMQASEKNIPEFHSEKNLIVAFVQIT